MHGIDISILAGLFCTHSACMLPNFSSSGVLSVWPWSRGGLSCLEFDLAAPAAAHFGTPAQSGTVAEQHTLPAGGGSLAC